MVEMSASRRAFLLSQGQIFSVLFIVWITLFWFFLEHTQLLSLESPSTILPSELNNRYAVVIDAGSSGSRAHIYFITSSLSENRLPVITLISSKKVEPGLASFSSHPEDVDSYLRPLVDFALLKIPERSHSSSILFLFGTAGLRLINAPQRDNLLKAVCMTFTSESPFQLSEDCDNVKVISGAAEGIFGWIAVNYLEERLYYQVSETLETVGFIDVGGASAQIVFATPPSKMTKLFAVPLEISELNSSTPNSLGLYYLDFSFSSKMRMRYFVYALSHLGFGANEAMTRHQLYLEQANQSSNPCALTMLFDECQLSMKDLNLLQRKCSFKLDDCRMNGMEQPKITGTFVGVSELWYTNFDVFGFKEYDPQSFRKTASEFCKLTRDQIQINFRSGLYPHVSDEKRLDTQCFKANYIYHLLHEGFGFPTDFAAKDSSVRLRITDTIAGKEVSWTLGALLVMLAKQSQELSEGFASDVVLETDMPTARPPRTPVQVLSLLSFSFGVTLFGLFMLRFARGGRSRFSGWAFTWMEDKRQDDFTQIKHI